MATLTELESNLAAAAANYQSAVAGIRDAFIELSASHKAHEAKIHEACSGAPSYSICGNFSAIHFPHHQSFPLPTFGDLDTAVLDRFHVLIK